VCLAAIIGLQEGLVIPIDNLRIRSEVYLAASVAYSDLGLVHPDRVPQLESIITSRRNLISCGSQGSSQTKSELSSTSENNLYNQILDNCKSFLHQSDLDRKTVARRNLNISKKLSGTRVPRFSRIGKKPQKSNKDQTEGINKSLLSRRKAAGECQRCAWPDDRKGTHDTLDCFKWARKGKGTAPFPETKKYQKIKKDLGI